MSSIQSFIRKSLLLLLSVVIILITLMPGAQAVSPWKGNPWEGNPWEGSPWKTTPSDGEGPQSDSESWESDLWDGDILDGTSPGILRLETVMDSIGINDGGETMCLELPPNDLGDTNTSNSSTVTDEEKDEIVDHVVEDQMPTFFDDVKNFLNPFKNSPTEKELRQGNEELFDELMDRPYGTVNDIDIPTNVLATLADMGYTDKKLTDSDRPDDRTKESYEKQLKDHGWREVKSPKHWSGFHGRAFINREDGTVAFSFAGTENMARDIFADGQLATGRDPAQYNQALEFVDKVMADYEGYDAVLVGHSLGGAIAQYASLQLQIPAITWNAPGIGTRDYTLGDIWEDAGSFTGIPWAIGTKAAIKEGSLDIMVDQINRNQLFDDLVINHVMEDDEIGTYQIHIGQANFYSDDGSVKNQYDYSSKAHKSDLPFSKLMNTITGGFGSHGVGNFFNLMFDC